MRWLYSDTFDYDYFGAALAHSFPLVPRCPRHLANPSLLLTLTLELKPSIFSFFMSNKCVRHLVAEGLAVRDPICCHEQSPQHLICPVSSIQSAEAALRLFQIGHSEDVVSLKDLKDNLGKKRVNTVRSKYIRTLR